mgnify:CR=1 FL=1
MRVLLLALALVLVLLQGRLWLSNDGLQEIWRLDAQVLEDDLFHAISDITHSLYSSTCLVLKFIFLGVSL